MARKRTAWVSGPPAALVLASCVWASSALASPADVDPTQGVGFDRLHGGYYRGTAAVVTTTNGIIYKENSVLEKGLQGADAANLLQPIGHYAAGEHFCMVPATTDAQKVGEWAKVEYGSGEDTRCNDCQKTGLVRNRGELAPDTTELQKENPSGHHSMCDVLNNRVQVAVWNSTIDVAQPTPAMLPDAASKHDAASTLSILGFVVVSLVALVVLLQRKRKRKAVTAAKTTIKNWPLRIASGLVLVAAIAAPFLPSDLADGIAPYVFQDDGTYRRPVGPILGDSSWLAFVVIVGGIMATASVVTVSLYRYWVTPKFRNRLWERYREKHYVFDSMVGEWQRVTDRGIGGSVLVSTLSRNKRLVREARNIGSIARSSAICCLVPGLWLGGFLTMWRTDLGWKIAFFLSLPMFWLPIFLWWEQTTSFRDYALVIDPPAVMPDMTPYGDTTPFRTPPAESDETDYPMPV